MRMGALRRDGRDMSSTLVVCAHMKVEKGHTLFLALPTPRMILELDCAYSDHYLNIVPPSWFLFE